MKVLFSTLLPQLLAIITTITLLSPNSVQGELYDSFWDRFDCPDPDEFVEEFPTYNIECVEASIPPWPMCLFHNVTYFIDAAVASASRCCDLDNLDECRCPFKHDTRFQDKMEDWCPKIAKCDIPDGMIKTDLESEFFSDAILSEYTDMLEDEAEEYSADMESEDYEYDEDDGNDDF